MHKILIVEDVDLNLELLIQLLALRSRYCSYASKPISASGTTSRAEKMEPQASTEVGVPVKYQW